MSIFRLPGVLSAGAALGRAVLALCLAALAACETVDDEFSEPLSPWEGTTWVAEDINGAGVVDIAQSRITFAEEGRVHGNGGCSTYFGSYQYDGETIRFSPMAIMPLPCEADAVNAQETAFLGALEKSTTVRYEETVMYLDDADGNTVVRLTLVETGEE